MECQRTDTPEGSDGSGDDDQSRSLLATPPEATDPCDRTLADVGAVAVSSSVTPQRTLWHWLRQATAQRKGKQ